MNRVRLTERQLHSSSEYHQVLGVVSSPSVLSLDRVINGFVVVTSGGITIKVCVNILLILIYLNFNFFVVLSKNSYEIFIRTF